MINIIALAVYLMIGSAIVFGALHISQYDLDADSNKWRIICLAILSWPIFFLLMVAYWMWACWHSAKNYIGGL